MAVMSSVHVEFVLIDNDGHGFLLSQRRWKSPPPHPTANYNFFTPSTCVGDYRASESSDSVIRMKMCCDLLSHAAPPSYAEEGDAWLLMALQWCPDSCLSFSHLRFFSAESDFAQDAFCVTECRKEKDEREYYCYSEFGKFVPAEAKIPRILFGLMTQNGARLSPV